MVNVKRIRVGDTFPGLDAGGSHYRCRVIAIDAGELQIVTNAEPGGIGRVGAGGIRLELVQGLPKGKKTDQILRQATECGVGRISLVPTRHSVAKLSPRDFEKKRKRWDAVITEAVQQSAAVRVPELHYYPSLVEYLHYRKAGDPGIFLHQERLVRRSLHQFLGTISFEITFISLLVGPEGGLSSDECSLLSNGSFQPLYLGDTILRTETAGIFAIGAVKTILMEGAEWELADRKD